jgi:uncharacterized protein (TIGR03067 family)
VTLTLLAALATGLLIAADPPQAQSTTEQEALSGAWTVTYTARNGNELPAERMQNLQLVLEQDQFTWKQGDRVIAQGTFQIDPGSSPRTINLTAKKGETSGETVFGIYELNDEGLRICAGRPGQERPTSFLVLKDNDQTLLRLRRLRP